MQPLLSAAEVSQLLRLNIKRVQGMAREGRLPARRVGRKWLFPRHQIEGLVGMPPVAVTMQVELSARNQLRGRVTSLVLDGVMAEVRVRIDTQELVSIITRGSAERMRLKVGDDVLAVIKSTEVMIGLER